MISISKRNSGKKVGISTLKIFLKLCVLISATAIVFITFFPSCRSIVITLKLYSESSSAKGLVPMACLQEIISKGWFSRTLMRLTSFLSQTFAFYQLFNVKGGGFSRWMITSYFSSLQGNYFLVSNVCHHLYCDDVIKDRKPQKFRQSNCATVLMEAENLFY